MPDKTCSYRNIYFELYIHSAGLRGGQDRLVPRLLFFQGCPPEQNEKYLGDKTDINNSNLFLCLDYPMSSALKLLFCHGIN